MNRYANMMEELPVPADQGERLKQRVLAAGGAERKAAPYRPWSLARKALLAAVAAAVLAASVGAASKLVTWNRFFQESFDAVDPELADTVFQSVETAQVCGDVTVTVREAVMDQRAVWLLVDYQLPEDTDMDQVRMDTVSPPLFDLYQGSVSWAELEGLTSHEAKNGPMQELNNLYLVETTSIEAVDPETRTLTVLLYGRCDRAPASGEPLTLFAWLPPAVKAEADWEPLADHPAAVTFTPIHTSVQVSGTVRAGQARYSAEVTALTVTITAEAAREEDLPYGTMMRLRAELLLRDGAAVPLRTISNWSGGTPSDSSGQWQITCVTTLRTVLDPGEVTAIRIGEIGPVPAARIELR